MDTDIPNLADRLKELESMADARALPRHLTNEKRPERVAAIRLVPVPRRSRVFLRHGEGHGEFADLTLTAPLARPHVR